MRASGISDRIERLRSKLFGFALCPYLDLTFHRARQSLAGRDAKTAFGVGFGVLFALMILFTLGYSGWLEGRAPRAPKSSRDALGFHQGAGRALLDGKAAEKAQSQMQDNMMHYQEKQAGAEAR